MLVIQEADFQSLIFFDQNPSDLSSVSLLFSPFLRQLMQLISGLYFNGILIHLDLRIFHAILEFLALIEKLGINLSDFF